MKFGFVKSSDLLRSGNWSAGFVLSDSFTMLKEKSDEDIINLAKEAINSAPDYVKDRAIKALFSNYRNIESNEIDGYRKSISVSTKEKVAKAIKTGVIKGVDSQETFVIAVCVYGMTELYKKNEELLNDAVNEKIAILEKLKEIDSFLGIK